MQNKARQKAPRKMITQVALVLATALLPMLMAASCDNSVEYDSFGGKGYVYLETDYVYLGVGESFRFVSLEVTKWNNSDESIATLKDGTVTGVAVGTTVVTAQGSITEKRATVQVMEQPLAVSFSPAAITLNVGETHTAAPVFSQSIPEEHQIEEWKSKNETVATVKEGLITAVAVGKTTVIFEHLQSNAKASIEVTVVAPDNNTPVSSSQDVARITIPDMTWSHSGEAVQELQALGVTVKTTEVETSTYSANMVIEQDVVGEVELPPEGAAAIEVTLKVAKAPAAVAVPNVVGKNETDATAILKAVGLVPNIQHVYGDFATTSGLAYAQTPEGGSMVKAGSAVTVYIGHHQQQEQPPASSTPTPPASSTPTPPPTPPATPITKISSTAAPGTPGTIMADAKFDTACTVYFMLVPQGGAAPSAAAMQATTGYPAAAHGLVGTTFSGLTAGATFTVYVYATDGTRTSGVLSLGDAMVV